MPDDGKEQDRPDEATEDTQGERSFVAHLLNQPEGPETPRARVVPRDVEF